MSKDLIAANPPPTGGGLTCQSDWEGTRVTLRPTGLARWAMVGFLGFWLCGWAAGEAFALSALVPALPRLFGIRGFSGPSFPGPAGVGVNGFLLVWLTGWTFGGAAALWTALRTGWGRNELVLQGDECTVFEGVGSFGRTRRFPVSAVEAVELQWYSAGKGGGQQRLEARVGGKTVVVASLGTTEELAWMRDLLRQAARLLLSAPEAEPQSVSAAAGVSSLPADPPSGWEVEPLPDGATRIVKKVKNRAAGAGCLALPMLFWNGITWGGVLSAFRTASGPNLFHLLFMVPFVLVGLGFVGAVLWTLMGREEWRVDRNRFVRVRSFLGREWVKYFEDGTLALEPSENDGSVTWSLVLRSGGQRQVLQSAAGTNLLELREGGRLVSYYTRWPLEIPPDAAG